MSPQEQTGPGCPERSCCREGLQVGLKAERACRLHLILSFTLLLSAVTFTLHLKPKLQHFFATQPKQHIPHTTTLEHYLKETAPNASSSGSVLKCLKLVLRDLQQRCSSAFSQPSLTFVGRVLFVNWLGTGVCKRGKNPRRCFLHQSRFMFKRL